MSKILHVLIGMLIVDVVLDETDVVYLATVAVRDVVSVDMQLVGG